MKKLLLFTFLCLGPISCGNGGGSGEPLDPGLYSGAVVYRDEGGSNGGCLDFVKQCFQLSQVQIVQQYYADGSSQLQVLSNFENEVLGDAPSNSSSIEFTELLPSTGPCGFVGGDVSCSGIRRAQIDSVSQQDRVIRLTSEINASCFSEAGTFKCVIQEEGDLQG